MANDALRHKQALAAIMARSAPGRARKLDALSPKMNEWLKREVTLWGNGKHPGCSWGRITSRLRSEFGGTLGRATVQEYVVTRWPRLYSRAARRYAEFEWKGAASHTVRKPKPEETLKLHTLTTERKRWLKQVIARWGKGKMPGCNWAKITRELRPEFGGSLDYHTVQHYAQTAWPSLYGRLPGG